MGDPFTLRMDVRLSDIDAQGHMTSAAYLAFANHVLWSCVREAGVDVDALRDEGTGPVNLETTIRFRRELRGGDSVDVSCVLAFGAGKTYQVVCELRTAEGEVAATITSTSGLLDLRDRRLLADPAAVWSRYAARPDVLGLPA
jgi:acyl-CoA thioester hydrolase